jgi:hypothetical protein
MCIGLEAFRYFVLYVIFVVTHVSESTMSIKLGRYRHFKGNEYEVVGIAKDSETMEEMVVYRALYGDHGLWIRAAKMFAETVTRDGRTVPRFEYLGD